MTRKTMPKKTREALLDEYDHKCAVCGGDRPHVHHIDEDPSNNDLENLLPLCPNCHIRDQHNPTRRIETPKLVLFRTYKDPSILRPQFHPLYTRQLFLDNIEINEESVDLLEEKSKELIDFVASLEMGGFYSKRIRKLVTPEARAYVTFLDSRPDPAYERQRREARREANREFREKLVQNRSAVQYLLVEMLRYQTWANA